MGNPLSAMLRERFCGNDTVRQGSAQITPNVAVGFREQHTHLPHDSQADQTYL
jgi:hypothetical protein